MNCDIEKVTASVPPAGFIPNPKAKLLEQVSEVMRFKHYSKGQGQRGAKGKSQEHGARLALTFFAPPFSGDLRESASSADKYGLSKAAEDGRSPQNLWAGRAECD